MINGIINVYKERGFTSFDVVAKLRGILHERKIGHTGTLDPEATGVLPVCIGNATKVCELLTDKDKVYRTVMHLGITTDTQDMTGTVKEDRSREAALLKEQTVEAAILQFVGDYEQIPPMYSALKVNGKKLCDLARAQAVKLEGGKEVCPQIKAIVDASIPVCAHLGLTPQSVNAFGGFKVQGKGEAAAQKLLDDARAVEEAGAFAVVLECVPQALATKITESIHIPTIGIGAGAGCDGQVLVYQDMLAMYSNMKPKFVKQFAQVGEQMREAFRTYKEEVAAGTFPGPEHTFKMDETVLDKLY